jgi:hypothetical protein
MYNESKRLSVSAITRINTIGAGGIGHTEGTADIDTVKLMMKSQFVTINEKTIRVSAIEITDLAHVKFYGEEVRKHPDDKEVISFDSIY